MDKTLVFTLNKGNRILSCSELGPRVNGLRAHRIAHVYTSVNDSDDSSYGQVTTVNIYDFIAAVTVIKNIFSYGSVL